MRRGGKFKTKISIFYGAVIKFRNDTECKYGVNLALDFMRRSAC